MNRNHTRRGHRLLIGVALAVAWISTGSGLRHDSVQAQDLCSGPNVNPIACENSKPGNPASQWDISGAGSTAIQGFATDISVNRGQTIGFKVDTTATAFRIDIYRMGYYAGAGARLIATVPATATTARTQPTCFTDTTTGLIDCGNWSQSASWAVPATATSGIYIAKLVSTAGGTGTNHIVFVVRDDTGTSDILFQTSDTTWQAYNQYGGNSLYVGSPAGRAYEVSYNRPFTTRGNRPGRLGLQRRIPDGALARSQRLQRQLLRPVWTRIAGVRSCSNTRCSCRSATTSTGPARSAPMSRPPGPRASISRSFPATRCSGRRDGTPASTEPRRRIERW